MTREITIETTETILSRHGSPMTVRGCQQCGESSRLVPFAEIVSAFGVDALTLHRWLNEGRVHFQLSEESGLSICWKTLSAQLEQHLEVSRESLLNSPEAPTTRIDGAAAKGARSHGSRRLS